MIFFKEIFKHFSDMTQVEQFNFNSFGVLQKRLKQIKGHF